MKRLRRGVYRVKVTVSSAADAGAPRTESFHMR